MIEVATIMSAVGLLSVAARGDRVCALWFGAASPLRQSLERWYPGQDVRCTADPAGVVSALRRYFSGDLIALDKIDVELNGTRFQQRVWTALRRIRPGRTATYAEIARAIGAPSAVRAVGAANGANPISLIVPCHRVIGTNGSLIGYGGGLDRKRWLLQHEGALLPI